MNSKQVFKHQNLQKKVYRFIDLPSKKSREKIKEKSREVVHSIVERKVKTIRYSIRGGATGVLGENSSPTPHKGHFCKSSNEKILRVWGRVTSPTKL